MNVIGSRSFRTGLAAALAGILAWGLVTVPPPGSVTQPVPRVGQVDSQLVQLEAATAVRAAIVSAAAATASTVTPTPAAATSPSALPRVPSEIADLVTAGAKAVVDTVVRIVAISVIAAGVAGSFLIAPAWYLSAPISIPLIYQNTKSVNLFPPGFFCIGTIYQCYGQPPSPPSPAERNLATGLIFLAGPFILGVAAVTAVFDLSNQVVSWLQSVFPAAAAQAPAAAPTATPTPAAAISPSANAVVPQAATSAATAADVVSTVQTIAGVAVGLAIAPIWYLAAPITIPYSILKHADWSAWFRGNPYLCWTIHASCDPNYTPSTTPFPQWALRITYNFLSDPLVVGKQLVAPLFNQVGPWLQSVFPAAAQTTATPSTAATVTTRPTADKLAGLVDTVNAVKGRIGGAASIPRTVLPKPLSAAVNSVLGKLPVFGKQLFADPGVPPTPVISITNNPSNAVKQDTGKSRGSLHAKGLDLIHKEIKPKPA